MPNNLVTSAYTINNTEIKHTIKPNVNEINSGPAENEVKPLINSRDGFLLKSGNWLFPANRL